jgi:hypothetical protein
VESATATAGGTGGVLAATGTPILGGILGAIMVLIGGLGSWIRRRR